MKRITMVFIAFLLCFSIHAGATVYYIDNANGHDDSTGVSEAGAFASLAKAADVVAVGDSVFIQSGTEYTAQDGSNNCLLLISTAGTVTSSISWIGYTTTPGDGGMAILNASGYNYGILNTGSDYQVWRNMQVKNATYDGLYCASGNQTFIDVTANNNGRYGIQMGGNGIYVRCQIYNNGNAGIYASNYQQLVACRLYSNAGRQFDGDAAVSAFGCLFYSPGGNACLYVNGTAVFVSNCTFDGDDSASSIGVQQAASNAETWSVVNSIFMDLATGIQSQTNVKGFSYCDYNLFYSNTTDRTNTEAGPNDIAGSSDPFTDSASRDYSLKTSSEALDAGIDAGELP